jgi:hypothetical protein
MRVGSDAAGTISKGEETMDLTPEPPPSHTQGALSNPFPLPLKPPDPLFPLEFTWNDGAFRPETFLESFEVDYGS